ncbi:MAG: hypothetical protein U0K60_06320, partial [Parafannyhessea umbonata]|jgi:hypothetical protein|nr:hypothetical protein [Parafannyhessea umbonata]
MIKMALYWPDQKVALEFLDDPESSPFTGDDEGVIIIQATNDDLSDTSLFTEFVSRLAETLGFSLPNEDDENYDPVRAFKSMLYAAVEY